MLAAVSSTTVKLDPTILKFLHPYGPLVVGLGAEKYVEYGVCWNILLYGVVKISYYMVLSLTNVGEAPMLSGNNTHGRINSITQLKIENLCFMINRNHHSTLKIKTQQANCFQIQNLRM